MTEARSSFGSLVRRAASGRERVYISDHGSPAAVIVSVSELEDLEDELALVRHELAVARGEARYVSHEEVARRLGLNAGNSGSEATGSIA